MKKEYYYWLAGAIALYFLYTYQTSKAAGTSALPVSGGEVPSVSNGFGIF